MSPATCLSELKSSQSADGKADRGQGCWTGTRGLCSEGAEDQALRKAGPADVLVKAGNLCSGQAGPSHRESPESSLCGSYPLHKEEASSCLMDREPSLEKTLRT